MGAFWFRQKLASRWTGANTAWQLAALKSPWWEGNTDNKWSQLEAEICMQVTCSTSSSNCHETDMHVYRHGYTQTMHVYSCTHKHKHMLTSVFFLVKGSNSSNMQKLQTKHKHLKFIKYILNLLSKPHGLILATQQTQLKKKENNLIKLTSIKAATTHTHICGDVVHSLGKRRLKK